MNLRKTLSILGLSLAFAIKLPVVHADDWSQATRFTFSQPIQIPGQVLQAGSYRFQIANSDDRHLVQIFREDRTLVATLYSVPRVRDGHSIEVAITLADRGATEPRAIVAWFFVGETEGHQFVYSKQDAQELGRATQKTIATGD
jgi:hypothetical protein